MRKRVPLASIWMALLLGLIPVLCFAARPPFCPTVGGGPDHDPNDPAHPKCPEGTRVYYYAPISEWICCYHSPFPSRTAPSEESSAPPVEEAEIPSHRTEPDVPAQEIEPDIQSDSNDPNPDDR